MPYVLLWFEAPLQSWGSSSRFSRRETEPFPTLSGVLGLICCARGAGDEQKQWLSEWSQSQMFVDAFSSPNPAPPLIDFQMVGSGYDTSDLWENLMIPKTVDGKKAVGGGTKMTYRGFIQDTSFAVILFLNEQQHNEVKQALENPIWPVYLGRKCCIPTDFIYRGGFSELEQARSCAFELAKTKDRVHQFHVRPALGGETGAIVLSDVPLSFGQNKQYGMRQVVLEKVQRE